MKSKLLLLVALFFTAFSINAQITSVAIVGTAVGGWPGEAGNPGPLDVHQMTSSGTDTWTITLPIGVGSCKFRGNNQWWSGATPGEWAGPFPTGVGVGAGDIAVTAAGNYTVTLNSATGEYNFVAGAPLPVVKILGAAVTPSSGLEMVLQSGSVYSVTSDLLVGGAKFDIDGVVAGDLAFPTGTLSGINSIPVTPASKYKVTLDISNGNYTFTAISAVIKITIVGSATPIGWPDYAGATPELNEIEDTQKMINTDNLNENYYFGELPLTNVNPSVVGSGELKFRLNNAWANSLGGVTFPTGFTGVDQSNIIVTTAGTYSLKLVKSTGAYEFFLSKVSIVGAAVGGWDPLVEINLDTTDGINYTKSGVVMSGAECKLRLDNDWKKAWGNGGTNAWPSGTAVTTCPSGVNCNIVAQAGTYDITFNRVTGEYTFTTAAVSTVSFQTAGFKVSPNPTQNSWNFSSSKDAIVSIQVIDMLGKTVINTNNTTIDASALSNGVYFAKVSSATATETVKLVKN